ncbi:MAG: ABC transporter ATP-binding protein [Actinomycetota bacterium]
MSGTAPDLEHTARGPDDEAIPIPPELASTSSVLRRGLRESPELRRGLWFTVVLSLAVTIANLVSPVLLQTIFDRGFDGGFHPGFVFGLCAAALGLVVVAYLGSRSAGRRLAAASERALAALRVRTFGHIHELSVAEQTKEKRGVYVARVTADVDSLAQFTEWGGIEWIVSFTQIVGSLALMLFYSWQLAIVLVILVLPMLLVVGKMQAGFSEAYSLVRTRVGELLSEVSESVMGAAVVRVYGIDDTVDERVQARIAARYRAEMRAHGRAATLWPASVIFSGVAIAVVVGLGATFGAEWGLTFGKLTAFLFLAQLFLDPFTDLPEIYSETQTAIAGWRKILAVLDLSVEIREPDPGEQLEHGALPVSVEDIAYRYPGGPPVLRDVSLAIGAGSHVALVGETGSGKTTLAKLLARLADPVDGRILVGGVNLREVAPDARRSMIRMVPQDPFLFDATVRENVRYGRLGASDRDVDTAFEELGLGAWVEALQQGLDTPAGERGEALSVGERQLVALARAQIAEPGLLILDEATSSVDPGTESKISEALRRLSAGRTVVTIAHRLSTAEHADHVFVMDRGRLIEHGTHAELCARDGVYARMFASWLGNVAGA